MIVVIFQNKGTDFPPIVTPFAARSEADAFVESEFSSIQPHKSELATLKDVRSAIAKHNAFSMTTADGATCAWTIREN